MAFQLKGGLYIEKAATDLMVAADTEELMADGWIRPRAWQRRNSDQLSQIIRVRSIEDQLRIFDPSFSFSGTTDVQEVDFEMGDDVRIKVLPFAMETVIDYVEAAASDPIINYESEKTQDAKFKFFQSLEKLAVDKLRDPNVMTNGRNLTNAERLDNYNSPQCNPILQLYLVIQQFTNDLGVMPDVLLIDQLVWTWGFIMNPYVIARAPVHVLSMQPPAGATMTVGLLESMLGLRPGTIFISMKRYNPARKGEAEARRSYLGSDIIALRLGTMGRRYSGFGFETAFTGLAELPDDYPMAVLTFEDPKRGLFGSQRVRLVSLINWSVIRPRSAYRLTGCVDLTDQTKYYYLGAAVLN